MARSWQTPAVLLLGGLGCLGIGALFGSSYLMPTERVWREAQPPTQPVKTLLPSFRELVQKVETSVVSVRAMMPTRSPVAMPAVASEQAKAKEAAPKEGERAPEDTATISYQSSLQAPADTQNGSGFLIHERGLVLTSRHVVHGATDIEVYLPNYGRHRADLIGQDPATDLALLRLGSPPRNLPCLEIGDSNELRAGDWIVAVGNPYGFSRTVTSGLVSFVGRHLRHNDLGVSRDFLQISAPVNPGSSGCPVFDVHGRVVGVTTQLATSAQGISFAVPSRAVKWALEKMREQPDGIVRRGYLGIEFAPRGGLDASGQPMPGAVIVAVAKGEPAERAGLQRGDVVLGVNGSPIGDPKDLHEQIVCSDPGTTIALQLLRDNQICDPIVAVLGEVGRRATPETTPETAN